MKIKNQITRLSVATALLIAFQASARENEGVQTGNNGHNIQRDNSADQVAASCTPATAKTDLDVNNVRALILNGGDMWWDLQNNAKYEVPKGGGVSSIFAGALWIGGYDAGGQLKVAAMTYRQNGNDFWPGPLDTTSVSVTSDVCQQYDKHWKITKKDVQDFVAYNNGQGPAGYSVPVVIQTWPGNGDASLGQTHYLAPYVDVNGDGYYSWTDGDYPAYNLGKPHELGCDKFQLFGDQTLWWVFNDKGNVHTETGAASIGLEVQAQAFAFSTNDEINNMTFYTYKIINRSSISLNQTYFGQWTDADLGYYKDDYVGCDVARGLGYTYNGYANDGPSALPTPGAYGANPPAVGMDFFEGPRADAGDGIDNDRDGTIDEPGEEIIMSRFVYYINDFSIKGNPENASQYYGYLDGKWKDGTSLTYGGNAYGGSTPCSFMFPGNSDQTLYWGTNGNPVPPWSEGDLPDIPDDRRMLQSAGKFTLTPGAVNYITVGAVWARTASGGPLASVALLRTTDDKAQRLFDNCFKTLDGPDAPDITIQELDKQLVLYLTNKTNSNNYLERYFQIDPSITYSSLAPQLAGIDTTYDFQGYQIFQLKDATVTTADLYNPDKARLVAECDLKDGVATLVNRNFDQSLNADVPQDMTITANDNGIVHSFSVTQDAFASGDTRLINHKTYYFLALAYAYNQYLPYADVSFDANNPLVASNIGQKKPYLAGRNNVIVYSGTPHIPEPEAGGTDQQSSFGSGPKVTRMEGSGSGDNVLDLTDASVSSILHAPILNYVANVPPSTGGTWNGSSMSNSITYQNGRGPVAVKVIDPLNVPGGQFQLQMYYPSWANTSTYAAANSKVATSAHWKLTETSVSPNKIWSSDTTLNLVSVYANEQIIPELGLSLTISQVQTPGSGNNPKSNSYLESSMTFSDPTKVWLTGVVDDDSHSSQNWIRAGSFTAPTPSSDPCNSAFDDRAVSAVYLDPNGDYEKVVGGIWAPYRLCADNPGTSSPACYDAGVAYKDIPTMLNNKIDNLSNVDIVFTNNRDNWTRVPVFEVGANSSLNQGNASAFTLRASASVDKYGNNNNLGGGINNSDYVSANGMSWFPGYAINVQTGERLNMAFGENSALVAENGRDMLWNPTSNEYTQFFSSLWGGMHFIYVFGHNGNVTYANNYAVAALQNQLQNVPAYDEGRMIMKIMTLPAANMQTERTRIWRDAMWANVPMLTGSFSTWTFNYGPGGNPLPCDVKVRLRVATPYKRALTGMMGAESTWTQNDTLSNPQNMNTPMYGFDTYDLSVKTNDQTSAVNALDLINVVPNPYYAFSGYETNQLDNRVKFTNLPDKCTIHIYTINGTLIRKYTKDSPQTFLDWDLKNQAGIPIASGLYIVHVDVPNVGEKILKFFGVMRPVDLPSY